MPNPPADKRCLASNSLGKRCRKAATDPTGRFCSYHRDGDEHQRPVRSAAPTTVPQLIAVVGKAIKDVQLAKFNGGQLQALVQLIRLQHELLTKSPPGLVAQAAPSAKTDPAIAKMSDQDLLAQISSLTKATNAGGKPTTH